jgi:dolichyl-phosphate-mannose-protein mannosyltransferase
MLNVMSSRSYQVIFYIGLFFAAFFFFHHDVNLPQNPYFDEQHYVTASRYVFVKNQGANLEHPPLAKEFIAISMALAGDKASGWRFMSAVCGALTIVGLYYWALVLFRNQWAAFWVVIVSVTNQAIFVQSRIAMLDIYLLFFLIWGLAFFSRTWAAPQVRQYFMASGICMALAAACKWVGMVGLIMEIGIVAGVKVFQAWGVTFKNPAPTDWYRPDLWKTMRARDWWLTLVVIPFMAYFTVYIPEYGLDVIAFLQRQYTMWTLMASLKSGTHVYMSSWKDWPFQLRPVWYIWGPNLKPALMSAVVYLSNPLTTIAGFFAAFVCLYGWIVRRHWHAFIIFASWFSLYIFWVLPNREVNFSFYYLPSLSILSLALAYMYYIIRPEAIWARRGFIIAVVTLFIFFYPILAARHGISTADFQKRMWLQRWI